MLKYEGVKGFCDEFYEIMALAKYGIIFIVILLSIIIIYTIVSITYEQRISELGMISSIGMDKKSRRILIFKETLILCVIGTTIGIILGLVISFCVICLENVLLDNLRHTFDKYLMFSLNERLKMKISIISIIEAVLFTGIIIFSANFLSIRRINKISEIDAIRGNRTK